MALPTGNLSSFFCFSLFVSHKIS